MNELNEACNRALLHNETEKEKIYKNFKNGFSLSDLKAKLLLKKQFNDTEKAKLKRKAEKTTDAAKKLSLEARISAPAYQYRIKRLETISQNIKKLRSPLPFNVIKKDISFEGDSFSMFSLEEIRFVLDWDFDNSFYFKTILSNNADKVREFKIILLVNALTGRSLSTAAAEIEKSFKIEHKEALTLARTESAYISGQVNLQGYLKAEIDKYEFITAKDSDVCEECRKLNNKVFAVKDFVVGRNYPPIHPECRCTTVAHFSKTHQTSK